MSAHIRLVIGEYIAALEVSNQTRMVSRQTELYTHSSAIIMMFVTHLV